MQTTVPTDKTRLQSIVTKYCPKYSSRYFVCSGLSKRVHDIATAEKDEELTNTTTRISATDAYVIQSRRGNRVRAGTGDILMASMRSS